LLRTSGVDGDVRTGRECPADSSGATDEWQELPNGAAMPLAGFQENLCLGEGVPLNSFSVHLSIGIDEDRHDLALVLSNSLSGVRDRSHRISRIGRHIGKIRAGHRAERAAGAAAVGECRSGEDRCR
jgi:hypothetical protein